LEESCRFRPPTSGRQVIWEITRFCNLLCDHCCTDSGPTADRHAEPATAALVAAAQQLADADITKVYFSGGEPLLREGFLDLLDAIDTKRVRVHVASNGYHLDDAVIGRLQRAGLAKLSVSLDGGDATQHDLLRRRTGAFNRTVTGISRAVGSGLRVGVSVTVTPSNLDTLDTLMLTLVQIGVPVVSLHSVFPVGRAANHPELVLGPGPSRTLEQKIQDLEESYGQSITIDHNFGPGGSRAEVGCPAQSRLIHIDPSGDVSPCSWLSKTDKATYTLGNIARTPLSEIVDSFCQGLESLFSVESHYCPLPLAISRRSSA